MRVSDQHRYHGGKPLSEKQILNMLEQGAITAEEAARLLEAIGTEEPMVEDAPAPEPMAMEPDEIVPGAPIADPDRWRWLQRIPLAVSLIVLIASAWGLYALYRRADARITAGWVVVLTVFLFALLATLVSAWMLTAPWLHVRISERDGRRIAISLPVPLTLAAWGIRIARRYVDDQTAAYLDTSAEFLSTMRRDHRETEPITVNVDEGDHRVQVYIG
jgi:hypothetical protein